MGRKSKRKANPGPDEVSRADRKELVKLCGQVIDLAATPTPPTPGEQWEEFVQINNLIEKIRKKQSVSETQTLPHERDAHFDDFFKWLNDNGISTDAVKIAKFDEGYGLKATRDIKLDEVLLTIPRKVMMTDHNALESTLGDLIRGDRLLKGMPNVSLAVFILSEKLKPTSFWQPYLDILPSTYGIPLFFSPSEIQLLQGSTMYSESLKQHKNIARQYAYLYKLLNLPDNNKLQLREHFTYDLYRWAVATVMTRQNQVPAKDGMGVSLSLIPLWDMCNHANGEMKTDFDKEKDSCVNMAMRDFSVGEQIFICYGRRSSADLLLYSGFVYPGNVYDGMAIQLGLSSSDRLYAMKAQLCAIMKLGVPSQNYHISGGEEPVSLELLTFLRIFCMTDMELKDRLMGEDRAQGLYTLVEKNKVISKLNELRTCVFLATRVTLLQRQYKTSIQDDEQKLKACDLGGAERNITQLVLMEKRILENVLEHCALWRERVEALEEGATAYPLRGVEAQGVAESWEERDGEKAENRGEEGKDKKLDDGEATDEPEAGCDGEDVTGQGVVVNGVDASPKVNGVMPAESLHAVTAVNGGETRKLNGDATRISNGQLKNDATVILKDTHSSKPAHTVPNGSAKVNGNGHILSNGVCTSTIVGDEDVMKASAINGQIQKTNGSIPLVSASKLIEE